MLTLGMNKLDGRVTLCVGSKVADTIELTGPEPVMIMVMHGM